MNAAAISPGKLANLAVGKLPDEIAKDHGIHCCWIRPNRWSGRIYRGRAIFFVRARDRNVRIIIAADVSRYDPASRPTLPWASLRRRRDRDRRVGSLVGSGVSSAHVAHLGCRTVPLTSNLPAAENNMFRRVLSCDLPFAGRVHGRASQPNKSKHAVCARNPIPLPFLVGQKRTPPKCYWNPPPKKTTKPADRTIHQHTAQGHKDTAISSQSPRWVSRPHSHDTVLGANCGLILLAPMGERRARSQGLARHIFAFSWPAI